MKIDENGMTGKDRALSRLIEHKTKMTGTRPQDIPELDELPQIDLSDILRNYQNEGIGYQD